VRSRRKRQHAQGDHSICRHSRVTPAITLPPPVVTGTPDEFDPAAELRRLADLLAEAYRQDPGNAALARELRATLLALPPPPEGPDWLEEMQTSYRKRHRASQERYRADQVADELSTPTWD
jgi:hypothetical protein